MEEKDEQKEFETGPLSVLMQSVKQNTQVVQVATVMEPNLIGCFISLIFVLFSGFNKLQKQS